MSHHPSIGSHSWCAEMRYPRRRCGSLRHSHDSQPNFQEKKQMTRFKSLLAVVVATAIVALAPAANAQNMHIVGAGSSAQFLGTMIGISTMVQNNLSAGQCQFHWTKKS